MEQKPVEVGQQAKNNVLLGVIDNWGEYSDIDLVKVY